MLRHNNIHALRCCLHQSHNMNTTFQSLLSSIWSSKISCDQRNKIDDKRMILFFKAIIIAIRQKLFWQCTVNVYTLIKTQSMQLFMPDVTYVWHSRITLMHNIDTTQHKHKLMTQFDYNVSCMHGVAVLPSLSLIAPNELS